MNQPTYILVPGAWTGEWIWAGIEQRLRARGQVSGNPARLMR